MLTILLTAVVLGVLIPIMQATTGTANEVRSRVVVDVYVKEKAQPEELAELRATLTELPNVADVEFISKEQALEEEQERNPEAYELLGANPLPDSFRLTPEDPDGVTELVDVIEARGRRLGEGGAGGLALVDEVRNREEDTDKILSATGVVKLDQRHRRDACWCSPRWRSWPTRSASRSSPAAGRSR